MKKNKINLNTYVISLDKNIHNFIEYNKLNLNLIKGINGKELKNKNQYLDLKYFTDINYIPNSILGCALSHIKCWKKHILNNNNYTLVLEDDFFIEDKSLLFDIKDIIKFFISQTPNNFDILYLGFIGGDFIKNCFKILNKTGIYININEYIAQPNIALGLHSYILSDSGVVKLLNNIEKNKINFHLDFYIQNLYSKNLLNCYITIPRIFYQTSTYNNISNNFGYYKCPFFTNYYIDSYVTLNYLFNVTLFKIYNYNFSIWIIFLFLFIISILLSLKKIIKYI
jgi:GR25 family glycosyltransferase involved in LPS biosynthesis